MTETKATRMLTLPDVRGTAEIVALAEQIGEQLDRIGAGQSMAYVLLATALVLLTELQAISLAETEARDLEEALRALIASYLRHALETAGLAPTTPPVH